MQEVYLWHHESSTLFERLSCDCLESLFLRWSDDQLLRMYRTEEYKSLDPYLHSLLDNIFDLFIFVRECLVEAYFSLGFGIWTLLGYTAKPNLSLIDCYDLIFDLHHITSEEDDMLSDLYAQDTSQLMYHGIIGDTHIDRERERNIESLHAVKG